MYFFHYNNPPINPAAPPSNGPTPGIAEPIKAPPAAVVSGFALVFTCPDVTGNPDAIGETKPAYCCKLKAGAMFCCLCIFSNCEPTAVNPGACDAIANCLPLSVSYCPKARGKAACAT